MKNFSMFITFIQSKTEIALPPPRIDEVYKRIDICSASSTTYNCITLNHC